MLRGLRRERSATQRGAPPLWTSDVERILHSTHTVPNGTWGPGHGIAEVRDRALLLLAFMSALRRNELAALEVADLEADAAGLVVHVTRAKTDQNAEAPWSASRTPPVPGCARSPRSTPGASGWRHSWTSTRQS